MIFGHRLTDYTGFKNLFAYLDALWKARPGKFNVIVTDPTNREDQAALSAKYPWLLPIDKATWTFQSYVKACWESHVVLNNREEMSEWGGLCLSEPQYCEAVPLVPDTTFYREECGSKAAYYAWRKKDSFVELACGLIDMDRSRLIELGKASSEYVARNLDSANFGKRAVQYIESIYYPPLMRGYVELVRRVAPRMRDGTGTKLMLETLARHARSYTNAETGKGYSFGIGRKNLWLSVRRMMLDSGMMKDDPTSANPSYSLGDLDAEVDALKLDKRPSWAHHSSEPYFLGHT
jgi:hypothetical protein